MLTQQCKICTGLVVSADCKHGLCHMDFHNHEQAQLLQQNCWVMAFCPHMIQFGLRQQAQLTKLQMVRT